MSELQWEQQIIDDCRASQAASRALSCLSSDSKKQLLLSMADHLEQQANVIADVNAQERKQAVNRGLAPAFVDRLTLNTTGVKSMATGVRQVASLADPVGRELAAWTVDSGLRIARVAVPLGVVAMIY